MKARAVAMPKSTRQTASSRFILGSLAYSWAKNSLVPPSEASFLTPQSMKTVVMASTRTVRGRKRTTQSTYMYSVPVSCWM